MAYTLKQQIAACYRCAEEYRQLYHQSSNLNERESYFITTMHLTSLANQLRLQLREIDHDELEAQTHDGKPHASVSFRQYIY
jgi:hypothetical protein